MDFGLTTGGTSANERSACSAIAIVGMALRFPGDLSDEPGLWHALKEARDLVGRVPSDRWAVDELQHPKRAEPGRSITFSAGVLSRIDAFDAAFFGISPREAVWIDPQQRLLLELAWEAMENAGIPPSRLAGSNTAVYIGISSLDYGTRGLDDLASMSAHSMTGNTLSIAANRLSYVLDLRGPSLAVDTACSSSLVALHHACNALRAGEASAALVGGVSLLLHPYPFVGFTKAAMLSAEGRCKVFDASGNGYVRAEGGAVLLLKPLQQAMADGDPIQAVILATGVNADGARKTGITIPGREGQAELMRAVLAQSGLNPSDIDYLEAHGTGTAVGDPIEAAAIGEVYGQGRDKPLPIGSVKANLGHMEAASGMAGLVKTVLVLKHRMVPPQIHLDTLNPNIDWARLNIRPVTEPLALEAPPERPLVAGVNSFGFGGANAHVLLAEYRAQEAASFEPQRLPPLVLSARCDAALKALAQRYAELVRDASSAEYYDIAYSAAYRRDWLDKRLVVEADTPGAVAEKLIDHAAEKAPAGLVLEDKLPQSGGVAFVYSGNGAQWLGMGRRLLAESPRFTELLAELDARMRPVAGFSVLEELQAESDVARLDDTTVAQPLLFAMQVAVTGLLREQGVEPAAVTGHSVGEVAAAWACGTYDLDTAIRVIVARSRAQGMTRGTGRMAAVGLSVEALQEVVRELGEGLDVTVAGINSPNNLTLSGALADLQRVEAVCAARGVFFRLLDLDYAFHSDRMEPIRTTLLDSLAGEQAQTASRAVFVSTVTGSELDGAQLGADYWWRNVREPVRFAEAVATLVGLGCRVFIEIGPHAILQRYLAECLAAAGIKGRVLPTLRREADGADRIADVALRALLLADVPNLAAHFPQPGRYVRLPNYPWQRERYWHPTTPESLRAIQRRRVHPLLGWRLPEAEHVWENTLDPQILPWLADHKVGGAVVYPGAAYIEMALAAAREWLGGECYAIEETDIVAPMVFDGEHARTLRLTLHSRDGSFRISSRQRLSDDEWTLHAVGRVLQTCGWQSQPQIAAPEEGAAPIDRERHYRLAAMLGLDYGPVFQGFAGARVQGTSLEAQLALPEGVTLDGYLLHPALLDVCFQSLVDFFAGTIEAEQGVALLPVKAGRVEWLAPTPAATFRAHLRRRSARSVLADFELLAADGRLVARATGCRFRAAPLKRQEAAGISQWRIVPWLKPHPADGRVADLPPLADLLARAKERLSGIEFERRKWFTETLPLVEALTLSFVYEAVRQLMQAHPDDWSWARETPLGRWSARLLADENLLQRDGETWRLVPNDELPSAAILWQTLLQESSECLPQLAMLGRVGMQLPRLLRQEINGASFAEGLARIPSADTLLDADPAYLGTYSIIEEILSQTTVALSPSRRLRVLEIVGGPSGLPRRLAASLAEDRLDYVLAVEDATVQSRLQAEYQEQANVIVAGFDTQACQLVSERDLPPAFDIVIWRHTLHLTHPHAALRQTRKWLAAGGLALIAERYPDWSADLIGGVHPDWWRVGEDGAPLSPLLPPASWHHVLGDESFDDIEIFHEPTVEGLAEGAYLIAARRPADAVGILSAPQPATWRLLADVAAESLARSLAVRLESLGQHVTLGESEVPFQEDHIVCLLGWEDAPAQASSALNRLLRLVQAMASKGDKAPRLWLLTRGGGVAAGLATTTAPNPAQAALWGFGRVVMNEYPQLSCTLIDLDADVDNPRTHERLEHEFLHPDGANEIVLSESGRYTLVLTEDSPKTMTPAAPDTRFCLDFHVPGQLRNLVWLPQAERPLAEDGVEVKVHATGLNFRDVMYLMGLLPDEAVENGFAGASLGLEFAGVVSRVGERVRDLAPGDAVMGFGAACFASHVVTRADAVAPKPQAWSFEAAATVPTVFFTVYYALKHLADLQAGERVLIHGAAGGVGIAAIQLARHLGAEVFATAGSEDKRDFVCLLGADHVFDSRSLAFADEILGITKGEGVDVVLNSLAGEAMRRSLALLKPFGRFLELGKRDFFENTPLGLRPLRNNISYFGIDADQLLTARPRLAARLFREVMNLFREGAWAPLPYRVFESERVVDAFRTMQQARHIGKIVVRMAGAQPSVEQARPTPKLLAFGKDTTWLVTGGLSGFGLASARWLAARGAGHLVLVGRRGLATPGAQEALADLTALGAVARVEACDLTDRDAVLALITRIHAECPPLKGVLHAAAVYDDRMIAKLDADGMDRVLAAKLAGAWHLHEATLDIPLDHFVVYSSVTTALGNPGQANYVAANAGLEALVAWRRRLGLPATAVGWGPIGDAGYLARNEAVKDSLAQRLGKPPLAAAQALDLLDRALVDEAGWLIAADFEWSQLARLLPSAASGRFALLNRQRKEQVPTGDALDLRALIVGKTKDEVLEIVRGVLIQEVARILAIGLERIDPGKPLRDLGMDSLMAVELALGLESHLGVQLPPMLLNDAPTLDKVAARLADKLLGAGETVGSDSGTDAMAVDLARRHGEGVDAQELAAVADHARQLARRGVRLIE